MGKKKKNDSLGRAILKDKFGGKNKRTGGQSSERHTAEIGDGFDWGRLNLQSVTEESNLNDFLATAELAGTEFTAEKLNITFVNPKVGQGILNIEQRAFVSKTQDEHRHFLKIPRRPHWDSTTSAEELQQRERDAFLEWRRQLSELQDVEGILLTPFEKNLEFWRQLWRVIERSDVIVQIVDARNPLLFRCEDLEKYVTEVDENKMNMILINKADFLTEKQREYWSNYFESIGLRAIFFSALEEFGTAHNEESDSDESDDEIDDSSKESDQDDAVSDHVDQPSDSCALDTHAINERLKSSSLSSDLQTNKFQLYSRAELIELFKAIHTKKKVQGSLTTIGLVGYPNVGKSSTINAILTSKKVSVSATPGKTKHFQTLFLDNDLCLCDCPGLVMPTFVSTKAEMVVSGILPIDQMRDHVGPVNLIASHIPRHILEDVYGIILPKPLEGEDETRVPTSEEFLNSFGYMRGFMTQRGLPDNPRASRYVLKDYVKGKLLYCYAPPAIKQEEYHQFPPPKSSGSLIPTTQQIKIQKANKITTQDLDKTFFKQFGPGVHIRRISRSMPPSGSQANSSSLQNASDKKWKKHHNKNKREKLRRIHADLDE